MGLLQRLQENNPDLYTEYDRQHNAVLADPPQRPSKEKPVTHGESGTFRARRDAAFDNMHNANKNTRWEFDGYVHIGKRPEHRIVYTKAHGPIPEDYDIHHIDHNKKNNDIANLIALPQGVHGHIHYLMRVSGQIMNREEIMTKMEELRASKPNLFLTRYERGRDKRLTVAEIMTEIKNLPADELKRLAYFCTGWKNGYLIKLGTGKSSKKNTTPKLSRNWVRKRSR